MTTKMEISAKQVAELRNRTGAGMMDCKAALQEANGDLEAAVELLRKKGIMKAEKRGGREVREGLISSYIHHNGKVGVLVEVNCETDFVARTDDFKALVKSVAEHIAATAPLAVDKDQIPADVIDRERRIYVEEVKASGKPANLVDKIVEGKGRGVLQAELPAQPAVGSRRQEDHRRTREGDLRQDGRERAGPPVHPLSDGRGLIAWQISAIRGF
jgi:elongation factor Ts